MHEEDLLRRKAEIEQRFTELDKNKQDIEAEQHRLQGEHRLVVDIYDSIHKTPMVEKPKRLRKVEASGADRPE